MIEKIKDIISTSISVKQTLLENETILNAVHEIVLEMVKTLKLGGRIYFCVARDSLFALLARARGGDLVGGVACECGRCDHSTHGR